MCKLLILVPESIFQTQQIPFVSERGCLYILTVNNVTCFQLKADYIKEFVMRFTEVPCKTQKDQRKEYVLLSIKCRALDVIYLFVYG